MSARRTACRPSAHARRLVLPAALLPVALVAGCGNGAQPSSSGSDHVALAAPSPRREQTPTPPAPTAVAASSQPAATAGPVATPPVPSDPVRSDPVPTDPVPTDPAASGTCLASGLAVGTREASGGAAAGSNYLVITFRNTSSSACTLDGHPGVSFVGHGDGTQVGAPAERHGPLHLVRLPPGHTTTALLQVANAGDYSAAQCAPTTADGFRIYPPGSRASVFVKRQVQACQKPTGSSPQLQVSAVGSTTE